MSARCQERETGRQQLEVAAKFWEAMSFERMGQTAFFVVMDNIEPESAAGDNDDDDMNTDFDSGSNSDTGSATGLENGGDSDSDRDRIDIHINTHIAE
jgi:hypothetical protein